MSLKLQSSIDMVQKVFILAGGRGVRFRPYSFVIPKPLMPIGEDPILLHLIRQFKKYSINEFIVSTGYQSELVRAYFGDGSKFGVSVQYVHEEEPLGTAGPLSLIQNQIEDDEYIFLINGDIFTMLSFDKMVEFAKNSEADIVVGCVEKVEKSSYGVLKIKNSAIQNIVEKPENRFSISAGIYLLKGRAIKRIPKGIFYTMPDLINLYLEKQMTVGAFKIEEFWIGIENIENMEEAYKVVMAEKKQSNNA